MSDKPSGFDILVAASNNTPKDPDYVVPNVTLSEVPTLQELREIRAKFEATITNRTAAPEIKDFVKELQLDRFTKYVVKTAKTENWEYVWNRKRAKFLQEVTKAEDSYLEKAAVNYVDKFQEYMSAIINTVDSDLPRAMSELRGRVTYMGDKELLTYVTLLNKMRDGVLDKISEAKHKAPTKDGDAKTTERELMTGLGLLTDLIDLTRQNKEQLTKDTAIEAEFTEEVDDTDKKKVVFGSLDEK